MPQRRPRISGIILGCANYHIFPAKNYFNLSSSQVRWSSPPCCGQVVPWKPAEWYTAARCSPHLSWYSISLPCVYAVGACCPAPLSLIFYPTPASTRYYMYTFIFSLMIPGLSLCTSVMCFAVVTSSEMSNPHHVSLLMAVVIIFATTCFIYTGDCYPVPSVLQCFQCFIKLQTYFGVVCIVSFRVPTTHSLVPVR